MPDGCAEQGQAKERFNEIKQELSQISTQFSNNLLDATKAFKRLVTAKEDVDGLPASALALAAQQVGPLGLLLLHHGIHITVHPKNRMRRLTSLMALHLPPFSSSSLDILPVWCFCGHLLREHESMESKPCMTHCQKAAVWAAVASKQAESEGHKGANVEEGPWLFTLDIPSYQPVLLHAKNRCGCPAAAVSHGCRAYSVSAVSGCDIKPVQVCAVQYVPVA
jgi:Zn-dependent oligopeptidase